jgi:hypothetical protein
MNARDARAFSLSARPWRGRATDRSVDRDPPVGSAARNLLIFRAFAAFFRLRMFYQRMGNRRLHNSIMPTSETIRIKTEY